MPMTIKGSNGRGGNDSLPKREILHTPHRTYFNPAVIHQSLFIGAFTLQSSTFSAHTLIYLLRKQWRPSAAAAAETVGDITAHALCVGVGCRKGGALDVM